MLVSCLEEVGHGEQSFNIAAIYGNGTGVEGDDDSIEGLLAAPIHPHLQNFKEASLFASCPTRSLEVPLCFYPWEVEAPLYTKSEIGLAVLI